MRILFDNKIFINQINGGPSVYFINLIKNIQKINRDTKISSYIHLSNMLKESYLKNTGYKLPLNNKFIQYNFLKKFLHKINSYNCNIDIKRFDPDILHTTYYENYDYTPNKRLKKIVTVFDLINEKFNDIFYRNKLKYQKKKILDIADKIICISNNTKNDLLNFYNVDEKKISVVHLGYPKKKTYLKKIFNFPYILFVGTRWKYKNFNKLLEAISISKQIRDNFFLVAFGGGKFNNYEKELIKKYKLDKIIQTDGNDEKLYSCYNNASLFVYPTKYEGFGLPILESYLYKCPVACGHNSSLPEVAGNGAIYFNADDASDISEKIEKILFSSNLRENLKENAELQLKKFSWTKCAEETLKVYKS